VIEIRLDTEALTRSRFALSPLNELNMSLLNWGSAIRPDAPEWLRSARAVASARELPLLTALVADGDGYVPGFLAPQPVDPLPSVTDQLHQVAATPADRVEAELDALRRGRPANGLAPRELPDIVRQALARGGARLAERLAKELRWYWNQAFAPHWNSARAELEAEVMQRNQMFARLGPAVFDLLHPRLTWSGQGLQIDSRYDVSLPARQLLLIPSLLAGGVDVAVDPVYDRVPRPPIVTYPMPPGPRTPLALPRTEEATDGLRQLLGPTRAALLTTLESPTSTGALADALHLSPATVSYHLGVMLRSRLVGREREGRMVIYHRTQLGVLVVGASTR
jgi:DNA-binding transcriptional ArsR family regulator